MSPQPTYTVIDCDIYMKQPPGFAVKGKEDLVCKLNRALYGLKQAGTIWFKNTCRPYLVKIGFKQCWKDRCVFVKITKEFHIIIVVYVDDFLIFANNTVARKALEGALSKRFKMKNLGDVSLILGIRVTRTESTLTLSQEHYAEETLRKFGMWESNPNRNPLWKNVKLHDFDPDEEDTDFPFRQAMGSIQWLAKCTRPDLSTAASKLACFRNTPNRSTNRDSNPRCNM